MNNESNATPHQAAEPDMRAICEALGFDPTNHHNAAKCPYCRPSLHQAAEPAPRAVAEPTKVPDFQFVWEKYHSGSDDLTALERFVLDNEPAGDEDEEAFRNGLQAVINELSAAPAPTPSEDARPGKSLAAAVADSLRPYLSKGQRVIWREPFRWHGDDGLLPNHYEMFSLQSLAADFGYEVIEDCGCAGIIAARLSADGATGEQS